MPTWMDFMVPIFFPPPGLWRLWMSQSCAHVDIVPGRFSLDFQSVHHFCKTHRILGLIVSGTSNYVISYVRVGRYEIFSLWNVMTKYFSDQIVSPPSSVWMLVPCGMCNAMLWPFFISPDISTSLAGETSHTATVNYFDNCFVSLLLC